MVITIIGLMVFLMMFSLSNDSKAKKAKSTHDRYMKQQKAGIAAQFFFLLLIALIIVLIVK